MLLIRPRSIYDYHVNILDNSYSPNATYEGAGLIDEAFYKVLSYMDVAVILIM